MEQLNTYVPIDRRFALAQNLSLSGEMQGTVLFADISGFTPLTSALAQEFGAQRGFEELTHHLNHIYDTLVAVAHAYQGSVITFIGDALICWFDGDDGPRGVACALAIQEGMQQFENLVISPTKTISVYIKTAVVNGSAQRFAVGNPDIRLHDVLAGKLLSRMALAEKQISRGETAVGREIAERLGTALHIAAWRTAATGERFAVVTQLDKTVARTPWTDVPVLADEVVRPWLLQPIYQQLKEELGAYLSDLRSVVSLFVSFEGIDYDEDPAAQDKLDQVTRWVQDVWGKYGGHVLRLTIGDKGSFFMTTFGAPIAYEDDVLRALRAATEVLAPPAELSFLQNLKLGMTKGQVHAGVYSGTRRRIYGVMGEMVNLAARLMSAAQAGEVLVSPEVFDLGVDHYNFASLGPRKFKGFADPIEVYRVGGVKSRPYTANILGQDERSPMQGREAEKGKLTAAVAALLAGESQVIMIEGEAGIGKSRLMIDMFEAHEAAAVTGLSGAGSAIEMRIPYNAWRSIFRQLFTPRVRDLLDDAGGPESWAEVVPHILYHEPDLLQLAPLLNAVLPLDIPDNELTAEMDGTLRAYNTQNLLIQLLQREAEETPILLAIEDAHWLDSASWALLGRVCVEVSPLLCVIATRPFDQPPEQYNTISALPNHHHLVLDTLPLEAIEAMIRDRFEVSELSSEFVEFVHGRAGGHPFFSEELAFALQEQGYLKIEDGRLVLTYDGDLNEIDFPDTIQGVITSRIDQIPAATQLSLKIASIIGRIFGISIVRDVHPVEHPEGALSHQFNSLNQAELVLLEKPQPQLSYLFKHIMTQEVTYNLMTFSQRRDLHGRVAQWYELYYESVPETNYPLLAHHWSRAEVVPKAIEYLDKAGEQALKSGTYQEAIQFLTQSYDLSIEHGIKNRPIDLALRQKNLGFAYFGLSRFDESMVALHLAAEAAGRPVPRDPVEMKKAIMPQAFRQMGHRMLPKRLIRAKMEADERELLDIAARSIALMGTIFFFENEPILHFYVTLTVLNIAERTGSRVLMARSYGHLTVAMAILNRLRLFRLYERLCREAFDESFRIEDQVTIYKYWVIAYISLGRWREAIEWCQWGVDACLRLGDRRQWKENLSLLGIIKLNLGQFSECVALREEFYQASLKDKDTQSLGWAYTNRTLIALMQNRYEEALNWCQETEKLGVIVQPPEIINSNSFFAMSYLYTGQIEEAKRCVFASYNKIKEVHPAIFYVAPGYIMTVQVLMTLWLNGDPDVSEELVVDAMDSLEKFAKAIAIGRPRMYLHKGIYALVKGDKRKAIQFWEKGVEEANVMETPFEAAWLHYELGKHVGDEVTRQQHVQLSLEKFALFSAKGTDYPYQLN